MSFKKLVIGAAAVLSLAACSKSNDSKHGAAAVSAPALDNSGVGTYTAGTPLYTFNVASESVTIDGNAIQDQSSFSDPNIASQVQTLRGTDKVIETKEQALELWSQGNLLLAFDLRSGTPTLLQSGSNFAISSANFVMNEGASDKQGQGLASANLTLNMQDCAVEQKQEQKQEQGKIEQGQEQGKEAAPEQKQGQEQGKIDQGKQSQGQDQGKKSLVSEDVTNPAAPAPQANPAAPESNPQALPQQPGLSQGQGQSQGKMEQGKQEQGKQEQGKEEAKPEEKAPSCHAVAIVFHLEEIAQPKQEQEQGKMEQGQEQGKQDQGKVDQGQEKGKEVAPEQKQGQEQGKEVAPQEKGKEVAPEQKQGQEQGKAAPIDQGKQSQGQDQGKAAPIDQGKQSQGQSKK